jgi:gamma-F420-2:alpha-L-glutamate ligase
MKVIILAKRAEDEYETKRLIDSFQHKNINVSVNHPDHFDLIVNENLKQFITYNGEIIDLPDIVFVRLGAGISPFQLAVIRHFEQAGVICINSSISIESAIDKLRTAQILSSNNIAIPKTMIVKFPIDVGLVESTIGFPCVVKVVTGSYGEGIFLCDDNVSFKKIMEFISNVGSKETLIVQEYLGDRPGEDLRVLVANGSVIGAMKRTAPVGDFRANITNGGTGELFPVSEEITEIATQTARVLGLTVAGIDLLFDKDTFKVCEANSNPGFKGFETYCNIDVADHLSRCIINLLQNK